MHNFYDFYIVIFFLFLILIGLFIYHNTEKFYVIVILFINYFLFSLTYLTLFYDVYTYNRVNFSEYVWCVSTWVCMSISYSAICNVLREAWCKPFFKKSDISFAFIYYIFIYLFLFFLKNSYKCIICLYSFKKTFLLIFVDLFFKKITIYLRIITHVFNKFNKSLNKLLLNFFKNDFSEFEMYYYIIFIMLFSLFFLNFFFKTFLYVMVIASMLVFFKILLKQFKQKKNFFFEMSLNCFLFFFINIIFFYKTFQILENMCFPVFQMLIFFFSENIFSFLNCGLNTLNLLIFVQIKFVLFLYKYLYKLLFFIFVGFFKNFFFFKIPIQFIAYTLGDDLNIYSIYDEWF